MRVLKFKAEWCAPCKSMTQIIKNAGDKITVPIEEIDIDHDTAAAMHYGVRSVPTMIIVNENNAEVKRKVGSMSEAQLLEFLA